MALPVMLSVFIIVILLYFVIVYSKSILSFQARGEIGDELIRVTKDDDAVILLPDTIVGKKYMPYRLENIGNFKNIRIYFLNRSDPEIPRAVYLRDGYIKLYKKNALNTILLRKDLLNITSTYHDPSGKQIFDKDSWPMAVNRSGIMGWQGYLELYP